jgi:hypothetical protein
MPQHLVGTRLKPVPVVYGHVKPVLDVFTDETPLFGNWQVGVPEPVLKILLGRKPPLPAPHGNHLVQQIGDAAPDFEGGSKVRCNIDARNVVQSLEESGIGSGRTHDLFSAPPGPLCGCCG